MVPNIYSAEHRGLSPEWGLSESVPTCWPLAARRAAFLGEACGGDEDLRRELESLLGHAQGAGDFPELPAPQVSVLAAGQRISAYQVVSKLGAGHHRLQPLLRGVHAAGDSQIRPHLAVEDRHPAHRRLCATRS